MEDKTVLKVDSRVRDKRGDRHNDRRGKIDRIREGMSERGRRVQ